MINAIAVTKENQLETGISIYNTNLNEYKWYWVDFSEPTEEEIMQLDRKHFISIHLRLTTVSIDCQRPKLDYYNGYTFYVTHIVKVEEKEINKRRGRLFYW